MSNNVKKDKYDLGQSESKSIIENAEEIRLDLDLHINYKNKTGAIIKGNVKDEYDSPIIGAIVKLMTYDYEPIVQTKTDKNGNYMLSKVPINKETKLFASMKGKKLQDGVLISPKNVELITVNFILEEDPSSKFGIISGHVLDESTKEPINEAMIYLFRKSQDNNIIKSVIYTNQYGQFIFREVPVGNYLIRIVSTKYKVFSTEINVIENSEIISIDAFLEKKPSLHSGGVIAGVIKDKSENIVQNAKVVLYKVEVNKDDIPVDFTTTNIEGIYYFNNIPKGSYRIKCTEMESTEIDEPVEQQGTLSPSFYKFEISEAASKIERKFNTSDGTFSSNRIVVNSNGFADGVGGPNNDFIQMSIDVPSKGMYKMGIKYLLADISGILKADVNGNISSIVFVLEKTDSWNNNDAKIFYTILKLEEGNNKIKFYNDTGEYSPRLGEITFNLYSKINEIYAADGVLKGDATITDLSGNRFVKGLDGTLNNSNYVELKLTSSVRRSYELDIQYLSANQDTRLSIDVNGKNTGVEYILPKTENWNISYSKIYSISINLEQGKNIIKLYNNSNSKAPWIGILSYKAQFKNDSISATKGVLTGGAKLVSNETMVGGLSFKDIENDVENGAVLIDIEIEVEGLYFLTLQCATDFNNGAPLSIEINSINTISFMVAETGTNTINDSVEYLIITNLVLGENYIRIFNASILESAYVGNLKWTLIEPFKVNMKPIYGEKYNGAKFTWDGKAVGIGGFEKGLLKLPAEVFNYGKYEVSFKYLTNKKRGAPIALYVNNELLGKYILPRTNYNSIEDAKITYVIANFDGTDDDVISFHNDTGVKNLDIGDVFFEKIISFEKTFFANDVETFDGAVISDELILGISEASGLITFTVDAPQEGKYDLLIYYLAEDDNKYSNISINWTDLSEIISFEKTNSMDIADVKFKLVTLELSEGNNIIKIHNRG